MITVIVPLDFSQTSFNAAHYTAGLYQGRLDIKVILYHYHEAGDDVATAARYMESLKNELIVSLPNLETALDSGNNFIDSLTAFAHAKRAFLIVMGLNGKTPREQRFSGSNTLKMAEKNVCPILIIPPDASFRQLKNVLITSEMKYVQETPVLMAVKRVLKQFEPSLHILNVDESHYIAITEEYKAERDKMEELLAEFKPEFYFMRLYDFHESVNLFARDKNIDMIIIGPKHHGFFDRLFKATHTKKLIYQSKVPVLAVHE